MQSTKVTDETWKYLRLIRDGGTDPSRIPAGVDAASLTLYRPIATRTGPFVVAQVGQSLDGRIATPAGDAQDVSGCDGIAHLHRCRALVDAVIVGVGTVVADNPSLSVRAVPGLSPARIVIDCNGRIPSDAKMLHDSGAPIFIIQADDVPPLVSRHEVVQLPRRGAGLHPQDILEALAKRGLSTILVEGGARTIARFIDADLVDRLHVSVSPIIIGSGPMGINLAPVDRLTEARRPAVAVYNIGTDIVFDCAFGPAAKRESTSRNAEDILMSNPA